MNIAYAREYYRVYIRGGRNYWLNLPENKWFNYLGEYTREYKSATSFQSKYWYDTEWKEKYNRKRSREKEIIRKKLNDEIGEIYYNSY